MKITLINPDFSDSKLDPVAKRKFMPLSLAYIAAIFKEENWEVDILEDSIYHFSNKILLEKTKNSDLILISTGGLDRWQCPPLEIKRFYKLCKIIKEKYPKKIILAEGPHTIFNYEKLSDFANYVIYGEPEEIAREIAKKKITEIKEIDGILYKTKKGISGKKERKPVDLTLLPLPLIEKLSIEKYSFFLMGTPTAVLETSRGCYFNCAFCFKKMFGTGIRFKTKEQVIKEIEYMVSLKIKNFRIMDLDFTANKNRFVEILEELKRRKINIDWCCDSRLNDIDEKVLKNLSKTGCKLLMFGIESLSKETHKDMDKHINLDKINETLKLVKKYKIQTLGYFRFGYLNETKKDIISTIRNAKKLDLDFVSCEIFVPYKETRFYEKVRPHIKNYSNDNIGLAYEKEMSYKELINYVKTFYRGFYLRPTYILTHLYFLLSPKRIIEGIKIFFRR